MQVGFDPFFSIPWLHLHLFDSACGEFALPNRPHWGQGWLNTFLDAEISDAQQNLQKGRLMHWLEIDIHIFETRTLTEQEVEV